MKSLATVLGLALTIAISAPAAEPKLFESPPPPPGFPSFKMQEIATDLKIGYAVHICDLNGDGKPDIVVVDQHRVVWYENPTWKMHTIITGKTKPDNVCICSVTFEGNICFVLGAGWKPFDTKTPGTLQWLQRGKTLDDEWEMFPIPCDEPTVHRVKAEESLEGNAKSFILAPLMGRDATKASNWMDGRPVRIMRYELPKDPTKFDSWKPFIIKTKDMHVVHNFYLSKHGQIEYSNDLFASYEGITEVDYGWRKNKAFERLHEGNQAKPKESRGVSEIDCDGRYVCTIEPWHGGQVVFYDSLGHIPGNFDFQDPKINRFVIDDHLRWGHAVKFLSEPDKTTLLLPVPDAVEIAAKLAGFGIKYKSGELPLIVAGVRDNPDPKLGDTFTEKCGVRLYRATDAKGEKWERYILEDGGVAVEDLAVADLNGDGKPDIIAVGRKTGNCRIYWNQGK